MTASSGDTSQGAQWQPQIQLQKIAKSISKDNLALVPLQKVSTTLLDVKRNGETLMLTAQSHIQKLKVPDTDDWSPLGRLGKPTVASKSGIRKTVSEANVRRPRMSFVSSGSPKSASPLQTDGFDWLSAFNEKINKARDSNKTKFQLPSRASFEQQTKQLVHSASAVRLEKVASQLMERPREALTTAQQTLNTCQQNLQSLQISLAQSFSEGKATLEQRISAFGDLQNSASFSSLTDALSSSQQQHQQALPAYFQAIMRHTSVETLPTEDGQETEREDDDVVVIDGEGTLSTSQQQQQQQPLTPPSSSSSRLSGPFQQQAQRRRQHAADRKKSSLREEGRNVTIVTTAALPWMTGTAVNPLLRAAYLAKDATRSVVLMIPWLAKSDQQRVFPNNITFETPDEQEAWVRNWAKNRTGFSPDFRVTFYPGRYAPEKCSILPVGDPTAYINDSEADVAILEEPEHLTWYHHGRRWTDKFSHVVGIVHTNYLDYARREEGGATKEAILRHINSWVTRVHCHKVVKLSDAVQDLPRQTTQFVHGVADNFLRVGEKKALPPPDGGRRFTRGAYFIGKCVWAKGYTELLDLLSQHATHAATTGGAISSPSPSSSSPSSSIPIDCYGVGEDLEAVQTEAHRRKLNLHFHGAKDHADESIHEYKVFINPSTSDVVATTTAEALAMGKWVVCADHPSNAFFSQFKNCLIYKTPEEFSRHVEHALTNDPAPMPPEDSSRLTWEAATERFLDATELTEKDLSPHVFEIAADKAAWNTHNTLCGVEVLRAAAGAGVNTKETPMNVLEYQPTESDMGGLFDDKRRAVKAYGTTTTTTTTTTTRLMGSGGKGGR